MAKLPVQSGATGIFMITLGLLLSGCVMVDSKVSEVKPSALSVASFEGVFWNLPTYRSESVTGLYGNQYLQEYFPGSPFPIRAKTVKISVTGDWMHADIRFADGTIEERSLQLGKDCTFSDHYLVFPRKTGVSGGNDSPTLGFIGTGGSKWTIDEQGNLVIIVYAADAGTIGIIPVGMVVRWMAVFQRVSDF